MRAEILRGVVIAAAVAVALTLTFYPAGCALFLMLVDAP